MTKHKIITGNSCDLSMVQSHSVNLIVTSPPYPMVQMWDEMFSKLDNSIQHALNENDSLAAFNHMHNILDTVWAECDRVLADSGFICINIGDAVRNINGKFQLFSNHTRVIQFFTNRGYTILPDIHWRKQSNAPNKFMGSGMLPAGAYVTYKHEYILVFRKSGKRQFSDSEKLRRQKSAYFWEERNSWFSDLWEIKGKSQKMKDNLSRNRSAAFPFEIPYRLVNMYSIEGDTVLDPFSGTGTTISACMAANRNSIGIEIDPDVSNLLINSSAISVSSLNEVIQNRIHAHLAFIDSLSEKERQKCYINENYGFPVKTRQEVKIRLDVLKNTKYTNGEIVCFYKEK